MKKFITVFTLLFILATVGVIANADYYSSYTPLKYGMQNAEVKNLENDLKSLGYFSSTVSDFFGTVTKQSVINYQRNNGLSADGIVGHATAREIKIDRVVARAKSYQGVPYVWGGTSPSGFDCSGFVHYTFLKNGITIPRTTDALYTVGKQIAKSILKPGDLVFFTTYKPGPSHVGIYVGNKQFIHASSGAGKIVLAHLDNSYFASRYIGSRRIIR